MKRFSWMSSALIFLILFLIPPAWGAPKPHAISFGKSTTAKWYVGPDEAIALDLRIRALYVDTRLKEYTTGTPHDVTDRLFVVRRVLRLNDSLPEEGLGPRWQWQRGGWLLVDRVTGRVSQISLPEFDPLYSAASWYRDYVAYCGLADDGKKLSAIVVQLGRRKPILKKSLGEAPEAAMPDSGCTTPVWQRQPARVTFQPPGAEKLTFSVRGHVVDIVNDDESEEAGQ